jgi:diaminohydroxyphosphoribosylaminopyrimidine deaminase/5-amino-6-(5-phosphoribosylamino)uracil reductase
VSTKSGSGATEDKPEHRPSETDRAQDDYEHAQQDGQQDAQHDIAWMRLALSLAEETVGLASPNPRVGCVLVKGQTIVGQGAHRYDARLHAEAVALAEAGSRAAGATAYVTLEPCAHTGRTGPCAEALVAAGVKRVVVATGDPNPLVNGKGLAILRAAGVVVTIGTLQQQARTLNDGFARRMRAGIPCVTLKAGLSLDGRIAPPRSLHQPGSVAYLTGARSLDAVQAMRHAADAVLTGIGTVLADDPLLTDRSGQPRRRPLLRVVLDAQLRLPIEGRLAQSVSKQNAEQNAESSLLICTTDPAASAGDPERAARRQKLEAAGISIATVAATETGSLDLNSVLRLLASKYEVLNVLTEAGSSLNRALLAPGPHGPIADKLTLFYAPIFLGEDGVPLVRGVEPLPIALHRAAVIESGTDFRLDAYLRDPWHATEADATEAGSAASST